MKKFLILLIYLLACVPLINAQARNSRHHVHGNHRQGPDATWGIFTNILSPAELYQAAIGGGINYKIAKRWDINAEYNYVYKVSTQAHKDYNPKGYRGIITIKRFSKSRILFYGIDLRVKHFSLTTTADFVNAATADTIRDLKHRLSNTLPGIAAITGVRLPITRNKKLAFEFNVGIGYKFRNVSPKSVPAGYEYYAGFKAFKEYNFQDDQQVQGETIYLPAAVRFYYFF